MRIKIDLKFFILLACLICFKDIEPFIYLFMALFFHELGHIIIGLLLRLKISRVRLTISGFELEFKDNINLYYLARNKKRTINKILIDLGGIIVNLFFVVLALGIDDANIFYSNLIILLINCFPIFPLDGGRILKDLLEYKYSFIVVNRVMMRITKYNLILLTLIISTVITYLKNVFVVIFIIYLWYLYLREKKKSSIYEKLYTIIDEYKDMSK